MALDCWPHALRRASSYGCDHLGSEGVPEAVAASRLSATHALEAFAESRAVHGTQSFAPPVTKRLMVPCCRQPHRGTPRSRPAGCRTALGLGFSSRFMPD